LGCIQSDVCDVNFQVLIGVGFASVTIKVEWFPLGWERGVSDKICEWVAASGLVRGEDVGGGGGVDHGREGGGDVMRRDVGCGKIRRVVGWDVCGVESIGYIVGNVGG